MNKDHKEVIQVWRYDQAPQFLKPLSRKNSTWIALIPPNLVWSELEALFLKSHTGDHPVVRRRLVDGSVLFSGGSDDEKA